MEPEVLLETRGKAGVITLNRPKALNALNLNMVREILPRLRIWAQDPAITCVIIKGAGERAFCAGGDVRALHDLGRAGHVDQAVQFWREEYVLNDYIGSFPKPYISLIDGICMGGGFGLSAHGQYRVAGERYMFAMPEVNIGLFPDVGGSHVLPRLPGAFGVFLALTATRIHASAAHACGLATHVAHTAAFPALEEALCAGGDVETALAEHCSVPGDNPLVEHLDFIADVFGQKSLPSIFSTLEDAAGAEGTHAAFAATCLKAMRAASPTSLLLVMEQMHRGRQQDLGACMQMELRMVSHVAAGHDFYEGVRAVLVDKDNAPKWQPSRLEDVDPSEIVHHFDPISEELQLLAPGT